MFHKYTYQDFEDADDIKTFIKKAISAHKNSEAYQVALLANDYDRQLNRTIRDYVRLVFSAEGRAIEDFTASNNRIASNFFNRLNTQRVMYSLGNGISFIQPDEAGQPDKVKEAMGGRDFDHQITESAYYATIHGISFPFWNYNRVHCFKLTEFVPLFDENDGTLRAGIRFWQLSKNKPMNICLYEEDGYTSYVQKKRRADLEELEPKKSYKVTYQKAPADNEATIVGEENYGSLPIVPMWTSRLKQSTLVGMMEQIDAYDLIKSGFANDMTDCAEIYWIVENAGGMTDKDLARFRDRIKLMHIANADTTAGASVKPYTQEVPHAAREAILTELRNSIYEDYGALDVHAVAAGSTNDHIDAAYQPMDENASDFEYWVGEAIKQILRLQGIDDSPVFTRQRISNQKEQVEIVSLEAQWLDQQTILRKLPNITDEEANAIIERNEDEDIARIGLDDGYKKRVLDGTDYLVTAEKDGA